MPKEILPIPRGESSRTTRIVIGLFAGYGFYNTMRRTFPQQMPVVARELEIPLERIGAPNSIFSLCYGLAKFFASVASDYVPCAEFHAFGIFLSGLNVAALGLCTGLSGLTALWGMQGVLQAFGWPLLAAIVVAELPPEDRAKYWGVLSMAGNVGQMLTPYGMVLISQLGFSWRGGFFSAGIFGMAMSVVVWWLLCCGKRHVSPATADGEVNGKPTSADNSQAKSPSSGISPSSGMMKCGSSVVTVLRSPALVVLMVCNLLSYFIQKCTKEWGAVYLRSTGLAHSDLQVANLLFWAELGGSVGACFSGFVSSSLGDRHALTSMLSALLAAFATTVLVWCTYVGLGTGSMPLPLTALCALQAVINVGTNGVRALVGLNAAVIASSMGLVGMANGWMEIVGQIGSVIGGQPLGALAAHFSRLQSGGQPDPNAAVGWLWVLGLVVIANLALAFLHMCLLPGEARRISEKTTKMD